MDKMLKDIKACIFDMDGTLVDSMWIWKQIDIDFFARFDKEFPNDIQKQIEGLSFYQTAEFIKDRYDFDLSIEEMMDIWNEMAYEKYSKEVDFKEGAEDFVIHCRNKGIKLGIATSNSRYLFDAVMDHLRLDRYFDCILTGTEITNGKPAPDVYLTVAERLGVSPSDCLVFEDIIPGIMAGRNAGMKVCAVADEYSVCDESEKIKLADYHIDNYIGLL